MILSGMYGSPFRTWYTSPGFLGVFQVLVASNTTSLTSFRSYSQDQKVFGYFLSAFIGHWKRDRRPSSTCSRKSSQTGVRRKETQDVVCGGPGTPKTPPSERDGRTDGLGGVSDET